MVRCMHDFGVGYGSINHPVDRDPVCGYVGVIGDVCPRCGRRDGEDIPPEKLDELRKKPEIDYEKCSALLIAAAVIIHNIKSKGESIMSVKNTVNMGQDIHFERIRRITGYLVGTMDKWNDAKKAEEHDRVKHGLGHRS